MTHSISNNKSDIFNEYILSDKSNMLSTISVSESYDRYSLHLDKKSLSLLKGELRKVNINKDIDTEYSETTINDVKIIKYLKKALQLFKSNDSEIYCDTKKIINYFESRVINDNITLFENNINTKIMGSNYDQSNNKLLDGTIIGISSKRNLIVKDQDGVKHEIQVNNKNIIVNSEYIS
jgi:hypothetical protein